MNDEQLLRYSRHVLLPQVDIKGQQAIIDSTVMVVGLGGLGSPVALYLAASGVGRVVLVDGDSVEMSNLQRQIVHTESSLGESKVSSAARALGKINSSIELKCYNTDFDLSMLIETSPHVVVDCTDSFGARQNINRSCYGRRIPLVSGAAVRFEGQLSVFDFRRGDSPCYQCLHPRNDLPELSCAESGVFAPLLGVIGASQAIEALKLVAKLPSEALGRLATYDGIKGSWRSWALQKNPSCPVCSCARTTSPRPHAPAGAKT